MRAIARALLSLHKLTGIQAFYDFANPIMEAQRKVDDAKVAYQTKKSEIKTAQNDVKGAADQFRKSS